MTLVDVSTSFYFLCEDRYCDIQEIFGEVAKMTTYIEVARMQSRIDRTNEELDFVLDKKSKLYAKTKDKYRVLALSLLDAVDKITDILEIDSLADIDDAEFDDSSDADLSLSDAIDHTRDRIASYTSFVSPTHITESSNANKDTIRCYGNVIECASKTALSCTEATECLRLLDRWFQARFSNRTSSNFRYNISMIPNWISDIIISYGKYQSEGRSSDFIAMFDEWLKNVDKCNWALPYKVHQISKSHDPTDYTMNAVIIGDIIMDEALYPLTEDQNPDLVANLECYPVAVRVKANNPSLLPLIRTRIAKRDSLISDYKLTKAERRNIR